MLTQKKQMKKCMAAVIAFLLCINLLTCYNDFVYAQPDDAVRINIGVPDIHILLEVDGKEYDTVTDAEGNGEFPGLFAYLAEDLRWAPAAEEPGEGEEAKEPLPPDKREAVIKYDINYASVPVWEKDDKPSGKARFEGKSGSFKLTLDEPGEESDMPAFQWKQLVKLEAPKEVEFIKGLVKSYGYDESESQAAAAGGIKVYTKGDSGQTVSAASGADGSFEFYPQATSGGRGEETISIPETEDHYGCKMTYQEFTESGSILVIKSKFTALEGVDFEYGDEIKFGYVSMPGKYEIKAKEGRKLGFSPGGPFEDTLQVEVTDAGTCPDIYIENEKKDVSRPLSGVISLDQAGPVIESVDGVDETEGEEITFTNFGIFTNTTADLTLRITVTDEGCGVEKLYMIGRNPDGSEVRYAALNNMKEDGTITSTFEIPSQEELLTQELSVVAVDYLKNESLFRLIRGEQDPSTITMEKNAPELTDIAITGTPSSHGWYNDVISFAFSTQDFESGLKQVSASVNGKVMIDDHFDIRENGQKDYRFTLSRELIAELEPADGSYLVTVNVKDNCNNVKTKTIKLYADIVAPFISISGISQEIYQKAPAIQITNNEKYAAQPGACIYVSIYRGGSLLSSLTYNGASAVTLQDEYSADGMYRIVVYAVDAAGNHSNSAEVSFTVDGTAPVITAEGVIDAAPSEYGWYNKPLTYAFTAMDETSGVESIQAAVNGMPVVYADGVIRLTQELIEETINEKGTYLIEITVTDKAGNIVTYQEELKIDLVAPELSLSGIDKDKHYRKTPTIRIDSNEKHYAETGAYMQIKVEHDGKVVLDEKREKADRIVFNGFEKDGDYIITAMACDAAGNASKKEKISFVKDTTRPVIQIIGAKKGEYYNAGRKISIRVDERYYKTNKVKVEVTRTLDGSVKSVHFPWSNKEKITVNQMMFGITGTYKLKVSAVDEAGNAAIPRRLEFTVDTVAPQVEITGVTDKIYTYDDKVMPVVTFSDSYYDSKEVSLTKAGSEWYGNLAKSENNSRIAFSDFAKRRSNDGVYKLKVTVRDKAGNSTTKTTDFAVNRFGSTFSYNDAVKNLNGRYVKEVGKDLVITERNISGISEATNEIKHDGDIVEGTVMTSFQGRSAGYNQYEHIFASENFHEEGVYQINVLSKDKAGNKMESQEDAGAVKFYVDRTAPVISTTGMDEAYVNGNRLTITASASDNLSEAEMRVTVDKEEVPCNEKDGVISFELDEGLSQEVCITAEDAAGNEESFSSEISVTTNTFIYVVLRYRFILAAAAAVLVSLITLFIARKKKVVQTENEEKGEM